MAPSRDALVSAVACVCPWYWLADLGAPAGLPCVRGPARSMQALHGGTAHTDQIAAHTIAVLLRGGLLPQASGAPRCAARPWDRRRRPRMRTRAALLAHIHHTQRQYTRPAMGQQRAAQANRDGGAERCPEPAVPQRLAVALALSGDDDHRLRDVVLHLVTAAKPHDAQTLDVSDGARGRAHPAPGPPV